MVTIVTKCGYHSNQLFLSLLSRPTVPTHVVGKIRPRTMFSNWYGLYAIDAGLYTLSYKVTNLMARLSEKLSLRHLTAG